LKIENCIQEIRQLRQEKKLRFADPNRSKRRKLRNEYKRSVCCSFELAQAEEVMLLRCGTTKPQQKKKTGVVTQEVKEAQRDKEEVFFFSEE
jgi:hypothetical protein